MGQPGHASRVRDACGTMDGTCDVQSAGCTIRWGHVTHRYSSPVITPRPIEEIAAKLGLPPDRLETYGRYQAKLTRGAEASPPKRGKLILVTAMTPPAQGVGKTVTSIGLGQALGRLGHSNCVCLRQPSLGPTLGMKGGAAGAERARLLPSDEINLHFTGDFHAVTSAHNLLAALIDNHVHFGNALGIEPEQILWPRVMDLCDRQLRHCRLGLGGPRNGFEHGARFEITAASEVMAVVALARDGGDLERRLEQMVVARDGRGCAVRAGQLQAVGAMRVLLHQALLPNLVQTAEHTPALVHTGPFANIAHGASSVLATQTALSAADYVVTEAGFGTELGAEKFVHIKCRQAGLFPDAAVMVVTCGALRRQGGCSKEDVRTPNLAALRSGLDNADAHVRNLGAFGIPVVVALNRFPEDATDELLAVRYWADSRGLALCLSTAYEDGGRGAVDLAEHVVLATDGEGPRPKYLYELETSLTHKLEELATRLYGADGIELSKQAQQDLGWLEQEGFGALPPCVAKTPYSLSDRSELLGVPRGHRLQVRGLHVLAGAGFVVVSAGNIVTMPGMPKDPGAHRLGMSPEGAITGL